MTPVENNLTSLPLYCLARVSFYLLPQVLRKYSTRRFGFRRTLERTVHVRLKISNTYDTLIHSLSLVYFDIIISPVTFKVFFQNKPGIYLTHIAY